MMAWTKARRLPGVRCMTSRTMATLPLYRMAWPLRRSFAAGMNKSGGGGVLEEFEFSKVLRIHNTNWPVAGIDHDQVVDAMRFENIQDFDGEFRRRYGDGMPRHVAGNRMLAETR